MALDKTPKGEHAWCMKCWRVICSWAPSSVLLLSGTCFYHPTHLTSFLQIQVIEDDRNNRGSEPFVTGVRGQVPPLVTTNFLVKDQGERNFNVFFLMAANSLRLSDMDHASVCL